MASLTSQQLTELGDSFLSFAQAVGNYRMGNRAALSPSENQELKDLQWTLLNYSDDFFAASASLVMDDVQTSLATIRDVTTEINQTYHTLQKIKKAINVAAAGVTLGAAIFSKHPEAIVNAIKGLVDTWRGDQ